MTLERNKLDYKEFHEEDIKIIINLDKKKLTTIMDPKEKNLKEIMNSRWKKSKIKMNLKEKKTRKIEGGHSLARSRPPIGDSPLTLDFRSCSSIKTGRNANKGIK